MYPGDCGDALHKILAFGFDLDAEAAAQDLTSQLRYRTDERDVALTEQGDAIANALHPLEQVRGQQNADALVLEITDDIEQLGGRLRIEP